ncbi:phospholipase D family protein [Haloarcula laminariae]|uniref:phospholipase D family protein n=1 Tax=Haloarcula laminariae TaxID=2961577 RepID=UPI0021C83ED9|nr:phospholipase D family protein [Halomicroarcula laminariae]
MEIDFQMVSRKDSFRLVELKSYQTFKQFFTDVLEVRVVTFCTTPQYLIETIDDIAPDAEFEVIVGDATSYREQLQDSVELADRLEQLRRDDRVSIFECPNRNVHDKLYRLTRTGETVTWIIGSANFSKNGWSRQHNSAIVLDTTTGSAIDQELTEYFDGIREAYAEPFMADLAAAIDAGGERREAIETWLDVGTTGETPEAEFIAEVTDHIDESVDPDPIAVAVGDDRSSSQKRTSAADAVAVDGLPDHRVSLSLAHLDKAARDEVTKQFTSAGGSVTQDTLTLTPGVFQEVSARRFGVPPMRYRTVDRQPELRFHADGRVYDLTEPLPDDPAEVDDALAHLESYFDLVAEYGRTSDPDGLRATLFEALLWMFWSPFATRHAAFYRSAGLEELDKTLPMLYIHGDPSSGKGTFARFALSLISRGRVVRPVDADGVDVRKLRALRAADTCFPLVVDDIKADRVNSFGLLRNYWTDHWQPGRHFPRFCFISNDKRPEGPERERMRLLHFDVHFDPTDQEGQAEVNRLIATDNPLFSWFAFQYLRTELSLQPSGTQAPPIVEVRTVMQNLYAYAGRPLPDYFPTVPAEMVHDVGRDRWKELLESDRVTVNTVDEGLQIRFDKEMRFDYTEYIRAVPLYCRPDRRGLDLIVREPAAFEAWLGSQPWENESRLKRIARHITG